MTMGLSKGLDSGISSILLAKRIVHWGTLIMERWNIYFHLNFSSDFSFSDNQIRASGT